MQNINVNIVPDNFPQTIRYSQGDIGRQFKINVADFDIPVGATVKIQATKPSGFGFSVAGVVADNSVTFTTTAEMTDEAGRFQAELQITAGDDVIGTANFLMIGERNPHPEGTTDGSQGTIIPELTLLVERVEAAASSVLDMEVVATTLPAGSQATYSYDEDLNKATFGIPEGQAGAGAAGVVASAYSAAKTYKVGDYVLYNSNLYRCTTAITTAEAWTAAHWTQIVLADDVTDLKTDLSMVGHITTGKNLFDASNVVVGVINSQGAINAEGSNANYRTSDFIPIEQNTDYVYIYLNTTENIYNPTSLYIYALYDSAMNYIANTRVSDDQQPYLTIDTGSASYIRVSMRSWYVEGNPSVMPMLAKGTSVPQYASYEEFFKYDDLAQKLGNDTEIPMSQYGVKKSIDSLGHFEIGKNLYNYNDPDVGLLDLKSDGTTGTSTYLITTGFIPLEEDTAYLIANENIAEPIVNPSNMYKYCLYDSDKKPIPGTYQSLSGVPIATFTNTNAKYLRVCVYSYLADNSSTTRLIVQKGTTLDGYEGYCETFVLDASSNPLNGKKWCCYGDSFTQYTNKQFDSGKYIGKNKVYPYLIGERNNMNVMNGAVSGSSISSLPNRTVFSNTLYQSIPIDADYITIMYGVNDSNNSVPIGTIEDDDNTTFYGAWNVVMPYIIEHHPLAKIGIICGNGYSSIDYANAVKAIAEKYGVPCLDLNGGKDVPLLNRCIRPEVDDSIKTLRNTTFRVSSEDLHPNWQAHEYESTFIETWLRTL